jgi:hypothetical protein
MTKVTSASNNLGTEKLIQVQNAEKFISYLFSFLTEACTIKMPSVSLGADGEIDLYWKENDFTFDLSFYLDGSRTYYAKIYNRQSGIETEFTEGKERADAPFPEEIINQIVKHNY